MIDAHQHFLDPSRFNYPWMSDELGVLRRSFPPEELLSAMRRTGVTATIAVQAIHDMGETRWLLELADRHDWIAGVVGWADLRGDDLDARLDSIAHPKLVGLRHQTHDEADPDWLVREDVLRGLKTLADRGLAFDLLLRPEHLRHVPVLSRKLPDLRMVVDHLAKPKIGSDARDWAAALSAAAAAPNVFCKISGLVTEADWRDWNVDQLRPFVQIAAEAFGTERLLFGSDWPVCRLAADYAEVLAVAHATTAEFSASEQTAFFSGNARRFYRLP